MSLRPGNRCCPLVREDRKRERALPPNPGARTAEPWSAKSNLPKPLIAEEAIGLHHSANTRESDPRSTRACQSDGSGIVDGNPERARWLDSSR